jgi:hypothetical protein
VSGQYFEHVYGGSASVTPVMSHVTFDGGIVIAGNFTDSNNITGYYLMKTDVNGNQLWSHYYNDGFNAYTRSVTIDYRGNIDMIGSHEGSIYQSSAEVVEFDSAGAILNNNYYPPLSGWGTNGVSITEKSDSSLAVIVFNNGVVSNNYYSLYSLDSAIAVDWNDYVGIDDSYTTEHGISTGQGEIYTISYYDNFFYSTPPLFSVTNVRRHTNSGTLTFDSLYEFGCQTTAICTTHDGGALIAGNIDTLGQIDIVLFRIDSSGNLQWRKRYGTAGTDVVNSIVMTSDSGFAVLSTSDDSLLPGQHDMWLLKVDQNGDSAWSRKFGGTLDEHALNIETNGNDLVMLGNTTSAGSDRIYVIKTDSLGLIPAQYSITVNGRYFCHGDTATFHIVPAPDSTMHIQWSTGDTINPLQTIQTENLYAVITDTNGVTYQTCFTSVYFANSANATFAADTISLCDGMLLEDTNNNDVSDYYQWYQNGNMLIGENLNYYQPSHSGIYALSVKNYCGNDSAFSLLDSLYANPLVPNITPVHGGLICTGDSILLTFQADNSNFYQWFFEDNLIPFVNDSQYYATAPGNYSVTATNLNGCSVTSFPFLVQYDDYQEYVNVNGPTAFCDGGEVTLSVSAGTNYQWSNGDTMQIAVIGSSGDYYVNFTDVYGCSKNSDTVSITVLPQPAVSLGNDTFLCSGAFITLDAGAGFGNYVWSDNSTNQSVTVYPGSSFPDTNLMIVFVVDSNNCPGSDTIQIVFDICAGMQSLSYENVKIYPSVIHSGQPLHIETSSNDLFFELMDLTGQVVIQANKNEPVLDVSQGIYTYRIHAGHAYATGQIVVE